MICLTKPHRQLDVRADRIAKHAANYAIGLGPEIMDSLRWQQTYRSVYQAVHEEGNGVPTWICITLVAAALAAGCVVRWLL